MGITFLIDFGKHCIAKIRKKVMQYENKRKRSKSNVLFVT